MQSLLSLSPPTLSKKRKFNRSCKAQKSKRKYCTKQREYETTRSQIKTQSLLKEAETLKKFVRNLSDRNMSNIEFIALGKGLKFIKTPEKPKRSEILKSLKDMKRIMRIRFIMHDKKQRVFSKFRLPSTWSPSMTFSKNLEDYLEATQAEIARVAIHNVNNNTNNAELTALNALKNDRSIVIKPFDKGRGIAIVNHSDYQAEIERQLNSHHYKKLESDITQDTKKIVQDTLLDMLSEKEFDESTFEYLSPYNHKIRTPVIYVLPKIHKAPPANSKFAGRPIISGNGSPTEKISEFVDYFLLPIVTKQNTYVKDTNHIIKVLEATPLPKTVLLATLDVIAMYTNTPQEEALDVCQEAFEKAEKGFYEINKISSVSMRKLIELILTRNCFEFNNQFYLQKIGCAMGSQASPEICDLVMHRLENQIIPTDSKILKWLRYRDDILLLYNGTPRELEQLVNRMNEIHNFLKFTVEISDTELTYLDLKIFKGPRFRTNGLLDTKIYTKPTETFQYLDRKSVHPLATFKGFIKGEVLRYARLCNNETDFIEKRNAFTEKLLLRNYGKEEIATAIKGINYKNRTQYLTTTPKQKVPPLVFKLIYTPHIKTQHLKKALLKHWHLISEHPKLSELFPNEPILAYKRAQNLKDLLVKSRFKSNQESFDTQGSHEALLDALIAAL